MFLFYRSMSCDENYTLMFANVMNVTFSIVHPPMDFSLFNRADCIYFILLPCYL